MPREKYDLRWDDNVSDLHIELLCFREDSKRFGITPERRCFHFKQIVQMLWGKGSKKHYVFDPWTDKMLQMACREQTLHLSGCASSRKTSFASVWAIVNWLALPDKTLVLLTSTSLEDSRRRIWGETEAYFNAANESLRELYKQKGVGLPGKIVGSVGKIRTQEGTTKYDDKCGIHLIAGDRAKEKENIGKLIGAKNKRVILIADELPELSPALVEAAKSNLMVNHVVDQQGVVVGLFQMIGLGNFNSLYDPFGTCCEPIDGWASITPDHDEWRCKDGLVLRFDGLKSPNVLLGEDRYPGQYGPSHLARHRSSFGEHSALFWRMCRSFPCPEADVDRIYSDADLLKGDVKGLVRWKNQPVKVAALDPAFATGGDRATVKLGMLGLSESGIQTLQIYKHLELQEDVRKKDESRSTQIAKQFRDLCIREGIAKKNVAIDGSGGGLPFAALLEELWKDEAGQFFAVQFGGAPSNRAASVKDKRPAKDAFVNRVAEIWYAGIDFVHGNQIKGLNAQTCIELTERRKLPAMKAGANIKLRIESKKDMKLRTGGKSPDEGDSLLILLELCRERLNFKAIGMNNARAVVADTFKNKVAKINRVYANANYEPETA